MSSKNLKSIQSDIQRMDEDAKKSFDKIKKRISSELGGLEIQSENGVSYHNTVVRIKYVGRFYFYCTYNDLINNGFFNADAAADKAKRNPEKKEQIMQKLNPLERGLAEVSLMTKLSSYDIAELLRLYIDACQKVAS